MRNMNPVDGLRGGRWSPLIRLTLVGALAVGALACDSVLEIDDPDVTTPELIRDPNNLTSLRNGALGDFMVAYSGTPGGGGGWEGIVLASGLLGDELYVSDTFGTRQEVDRRNVTPENSNLLAVFRNLHRARRAAEVAAELYEEFEPAAVGRAEVLSIAAYTYTIFSENYCSGVPFSRLTQDNRLEYGTPKTTLEMQEQALAYFTTAETVADAAGNATQRNLARIGKGRVLLGMGRFTDAANAVAAVPTSFRYELEHSENTSRQNNGIWLITHSRRGFGVAHMEGGNGLPYRQGSSQDASSQDPRVRYTRNHLRAIDSPYAHFWQLKYPQRSANSPLATGVEARLIEAEVALRDGQLIPFVDIHNALRETMDLAPVSLTDVQAMTQAEREDLHFQERAFWLWLTGQRLSDMRRLARQYDRPTETVFPTGTYGRLLYADTRLDPAVADADLEFRVQGTYGPDVNFPVPFDEQNNPNFEQCINRNP
jgi:starch-binding outer membrane protein, SusD/RagB family